MNQCAKCQHKQGARCFLSGWVIDKAWKEKCKSRKYFLIHRDGKQASDSNNPVMRLMRNVIKF